MKKSLIIFSMFALISQFAFAEDARQCIREYDGRNFQSEWGTNCGSKNSMYIPITNDCNVPIYVKFCLETTNGRWDCRSDSSLSPGRTNQGFWTCNATGNFEWAACTGGYKECGFEKR